jgi:hypothetical protein
MATAAGGRAQPIGKAGEGLVRNALDGDKPVFLKARDLPGKGMEFAIAGQDARDPPLRQRRQKARDEIMGVGRKGDGFGVGQVQDACDATLHGGNDLAEDDAPLLIRMQAGIIPGCQLGLAGDVRPVMMAVRRKMNPPLDGTVTAEMG